MLKLTTDRHEASRGLCDSRASCFLMAIFRRCFSITQPKKRCIKVICTSFRFAAVERQTVKRKTLKSWVKFGVAAPRPWGRHQNLNPRGQFV